MADRYGSDLRRWLCSAERLSDRAIFFGSFSVNMPFFKSRALELSVTFCDQRLGDFFEAIISLRQIELRPGNLVTCCCARICQQVADPTRLEHPRDCQLLG